MMKNDDENWFLFQNCIPVKGAIRSIVYDLQRNTFFYIPNQLYEIIKNGKLPSINFLLNEYGHENLTTIKEYYNLLIENESIYQTDNPEFFPELSMTYEKSGLVDNAIIDRNKNSKFLVTPIFDQLEGLGCHHLELRFYDCVDFQYLKDLFFVLKNRVFSSILILLKHNPEISRENYFELLSLNSRIVSLTIHGTPELNTEENYHNRLYFLQEEIKDSNCCGIISFQTFQLNIEMFSESQQFNNCLNRKISIDVSGDIKNCPSDIMKFGNIANTTLQNALLNKNFYKKWGVKKDEIEVCQDCEFRYMCSDCRIYIKDDSNVFSKPLKCNYNPYIGKWED